MATMWTPGEPGTTLRTGGTSPTQAVSEMCSPEPRGYVVRPLPECAPYRQCSGRVIGQSTRGTTTNHQCKRKARFLRVYDRVAFAVCDRHLGASA
jgi:hypothetical protein